MRSGCRPASALLLVLLSLLPAAASAQIVLRTALQSGSLAKYAPDDVEKFVLSALPGVRLQYSPQPPAAIPVRPETCYFSLESKGPMFERMLKAQSISIYAPEGLRELKLELLAVVA